VKRPHLDRAPAHVGQAPGPPERRVEIGDVEDVVAQQVLLRLREGTVADEPLAVAVAHRRGALRRVELVAGDEHADLAHLGGQREPLLERAALRLRPGGVGRAVDQEHLLHRLSSSASEA
jgi:hypothetical protein